MPRNLTMPLNLFDQGIELFIVVRARHLIAKVADRRASVFEAVVKHVQRDHDGRDGIGHHQPIPIPRMPTIPASPVIQSALFIMASA